MLLRSVPWMARAADVIALPSTPPQAIAAFEGRSDVTPEDIYRVIPLCLR